MTYEQLVAEWLKKNDVTEWEAYARTDPDTITWKRTKGLKKKEKAGKRPRIKKFLSQRPYMGGDTHSDIQ